MTSTIYTDERSSLSTQRSSLIAIKASLEVLAIDDLESGRQLQATNAQIESLNVQIKEIDDRSAVAWEESECFNRKMLIFMAISLTTVFVIAFGFNFFS